MKEGRPGLLRRLPKIGDHLHRSFLLLILVLTMLFVTSRQSLILVQHQFAPLPQPAQSMGKR